jgi:hypothetical protein
MEAYRFSDEKIWRVFQFSEVVLIFCWDQELDIPGNIKGISEHLLTMQPSFPLNVGC